jgi:hypothetical protein
MHAGRFGQAHLNIRGSGLSKYPSMLLLTFKEQHLTHHFIELGSILTLPVGGNRCGEHAHTIPFGPKSPSSVYIQRTAFGRGISKHTVNDMCAAYVYGSGRNCWVQCVALELQSWSAAKWYHSYYSCYLSVLLSSFYIFLITWSSQLLFLLSLGLIFLPFLSEVVDGAKVLKMFHFRCKS